jgi:hypothetical protein
VDLDVDRPTDRPAATLGTVLGLAVRLLLLCLVVGLFMAYFDLTPARILADAAGTIRHGWELAVGFAGWAVPYILLGASVVVPVAAVIVVLRFIQR